MRQFPLILLFRALGLWLRGRVRFHRDLEGCGLDDRGEPFVAFRKVVVKPTKDQPAQPGAIFQVRFRFKNLSAAANRRLSLIPIPLIVAQPGFRSKTWALDRVSGEFQGVYEWDTVAAAEIYWTSFPMRLMKRRAVPETLVYEIEELPAGQLLHPAQTAHA